MIFFSISFFLCCFTPSLSQIDQTFTSLSSSSSNSHLYRFIILLTTATEVHAPSLKLTHRSSIANPCTITHLQNPIHSSIILTDSSSSSLLTRFIIANPRTITNPFSFSSIILAEALYSISHHRGQWARVYVCDSGLVFSDLWAFWCHWWYFWGYFVDSGSRMGTGRYHLHWRRAQGCTRGRHLWLYQTHRGRQRSLRCYIQDPWHIPRREYYT